MASTSTTLLWWKIRWHIVDRDWSIVADSLIVNITTCDIVWLQVVSRIIHPGADHSLHIMDKLSVSHSAHISFRKSENSVAFLQNSCELPQHSWWHSRMWSLSGITGIVNWFLRLSVQRFFQTQHLPVYSTNRGRTMCLHFVSWMFLFETDLCAWSLSRTNAAP